MASDNSMSVNLPAVEWGTGTPSGEAASESLRKGKRRSDKAGPSSAKKDTPPASVPFEEAAPHEVDSFA